MKVVSRIFELYRKKKYITHLLKHGSIIHRSIELKNEKYIDINSPVYMGENCKLLCWDKYTSGKEMQKLEPHLQIGKNVHVTRGLVCQCAGSTIISDDVLIASDVFIVDFNHGKNPLSLNYLDNDLDVKDVKIGKGVWIGNSVIILPGVEIGEKAIVAGGAIVTHNVPSYSIVAGNPAKVIKKFNFDTNKWDRVF